MSFRRVGRYARPDGLTRGRDDRGEYVQQRTPVFDGETGEQVGWLDGVKIYVKADPE